MKRLQVIFDLIGTSNDQVIDNWIQIAASKSVQWLELDFLSYMIFFEPRTAVYNFPSCRLRSLRSLSLKHVIISRGSPKSLLLDCPNLEELKISYTRSLNNFKLYSLSLKHLTLWAYDDKVDANISAPNLLSFAYSTSYLDEINLVLENAPQLRYVNIDCEWRHIQSHLSQLHELVLNMLARYRSRGQLLADDHPELTSLKNLTIKKCVIMDCCFRDFVGYLKAAPLLENLTLELVSPVMLTEADWNKEEDHHHYNLKTVKIIGLGKLDDVEIFRYFLSRAPLLEMIIIDPCPPCLLGTRKEISYRLCADQYKRDRDHVINLISSNSFNTISIVIFENGE